MNFLHKKKKMHGIAKSPMKKITAKAEKPVAKKFGKIRLAVPTNQKTPITAAKTEKKADKNVATEITKFLKETISAQINNKTKEV